MDTLPLFNNIRNYEYVNTDVSVVGRHKKNSHFWKTTLKASPFVQGTVDEGYIVPFKEQPTPFSAENNKSSQQHQDLQY